LEGWRSGCFVPKPWRDSGFLRTGVFGSIGRIPLGGMSKPGGSAARYFGVEASEQPALWLRSQARQALCGNAA
jgi:hypothetical protein